jgi:PPOX class probable FMN-dependent enzyme
MRDPPAARSGQMGAHGLHPSLSVGVVVSHFDGEAVSDPVDALVLDLLEWIGPAGRPYREVIEAWRTSCPRLPVWEEANARGLIDHGQSGSTEMMVAVSPLGAARLAERRRSLDNGPADTLRSLDDLRVLFLEPRERAVKKQIDHLDIHCRSYIALSPFVVLATAGASGIDASPRGGAPGFVKVVDARTLLLPDAPGNNRLDSFRNIIESGQVGLLFMIPGFDETLRVNGTAVLSTAPVDLTRCADERRTPKVVVRVAVREAFLHCAKAFMRSRLWDESSKVGRDTLPTLGQMIGDQTGIEGPVETREQMIKRYLPDL